MSTRRNSWGWRRPVRKGDDLTIFIVPKVEKIRSLNLPEPQGPTWACSGKTLPLYGLRVGILKSRSCEWEADVRQSILRAECPTNYSHTGCQVSGAETHSQNTESWLNSIYIMLFCYIPDTQLRCPDQYCNLNFSNLKFSVLNMKCTNLSSRLKSIFSFCGTLLLNIELR
jgi:hypothetical protein